MPVVQHTALKFGRQRSNSIVFIRVFPTSRCIRGNGSIMSVLKRKHSFLFWRASIGMLCVSVNPRSTDFVLQMCHQNQHHPLHHFLLRNFNFQIIDALEPYQHKVINLSRLRIPSQSCCFCYLTICFGWGIKEDSETTGAGQFFIVWAKG